MRVLAIFLFLIAASQPLFAQEAPLPHERPVETGTGAAVETPTVDTPAVEEAPLVPLPRPRPAGEAAEAATPVRQEIVPEIPKPRVYQAACPAVIAGLVEARMTEPLVEGACGERSPLAVTGVLVNGRMIPLSGEVTINCGMASALPAWASAIDGYLEARENTRLTRILVGTSYFCRSRNNVTGADLSEHGFANALDVVGFELADGRTITLPAGWSDPLSPEGRLLRFAHDTACSQFTTTLGPEANAQHADHLHLDLGCHGKTCTARLCE